MSLKSKRLELAIAIVWEILEEEGGKANWTTIYAKWIKKIAKYPQIYVGDLLDQALSYFPVDTRRGLYELTSSIVKPKRPDEIAEEIVREIEAVKAGTTRIQELISPISIFGRSIKEKMKLPKDYLRDWRTTPEKVIEELNYVSLNPSSFLRKYRKRAAAEFEFLVAKAMCILFQLPLVIEQSREPTKDLCVVWRGKALNYQALEFAPGGASDIIIRARGPYYVLVEATLRYSPKQWKEEIEPVTRHLKEFIINNKLNHEDVYLIFITPKEIHSNTYDWLHLKSADYRIVVLDVDSLVKITTASMYYWGLPHLQIQRLFEQLSRRMAQNYDVKQYYEDLMMIVDQWCKDILEHNMPTFIAIKAYEVLCSMNGLAKVRALIDKLKDNKSIERYLILINKDPEHVTKMAKYWLRELTLLGLAREIDGTLIAMSLSEFENRILKTLGYVSSLIKT